MDYSLREEIEESIDDALEDIDVNYDIDFEPSGSDGQNACFTVEFDEDTTYEGFDDDVEDAIDDSGICAEYGLYYFWEDEDLCICTDGWD